MFLAQTVHNVHMGIPADAGLKKERPTDDFQMRGQIQTKSKVVYEDSKIM